MFEKRLRVVMIVFASGWLIVLLRLFQLQIVQADYYQQRAQQRLIKSTKVLEPMRGRILDRHGRVLASDEPAWAVSLHYRLLTAISGDRDDADDYYGQLAEELLGDDRVLQRHARQMLKNEGLSSPDQSLVEALIALLAREIDADWVGQQVNLFWESLPGRFPEESNDTLSARVDELTRVLARWKADYVGKHKLSPDQARKPQIREEKQCHALIEGLTHQQRRDTQRWLQRRFGWLVELGAVEITDSGSRVYHQAESLAHVVGQLRQVRPKDIADRPYQLEGKVVDSGGYRGRDLIGESGIEGAREQDLRGRRGSLTTYRDERPPRRIDALPGRDVELTLDYELQSAIYSLLEARVTDFHDVPGGSVVLLDIPTRQVLAVVSYPAYDPNHYRLYDYYARLSRDVESFPLHFRAVYSRYEPGSIVKPLTVIAAHCSGLITEQTMFECRGRLDPKVKKFRCWVPAGRTQSILHGLINSEEAIKGSCNVFCFHLGDLFRKHGGGAEMGAQLMCEWMNRFGLGRSTGIGLPEESKGIVPFPSYLRRVKKRAARVSDPRNYSIGQGEMQVTPIQAANLVATYASGEHRPLRLLADQDDRSGTQLPVEQAVWRIIRRGMYQVINEAGGTARQYAHLDHPRFVLCGKSGSAQTTRWITAYRVDYRHDDGEASRIVPANTANVARDEFVRLEISDREITGQQVAHESAELSESILRATPIQFWPDGEEPDRKYSHAWFVAFIQPKGAAGLPDWHAPARIAIAVLLEFGGSGGGTSGPLCRDVAQLIINDFPHYVDAHATLALRQP